MITSRHPARRSVAALVLVALLAALICLLQPAAAHASGTGTITGTVTGGGDPNHVIQGIFVTDSLSTNQAPLFATTDSNGTFTISNAPVGSQSLTFNDGSYPYATWATTTASVSVTDGATATVNVDLSVRPNYTVSGTVTDASGGAAIAGITVSVSALQGGYESGVTDSLGHYSIDHVGDPLVTVSAASSSTVWRSYSVSNVTASSNPVVDISLTAIPSGTSTVQGVIYGVGTPSVPLAGAGVNLAVNSIGYSQSVVTDSSGTYSFTNVPAGSASLNVNGPTSSGGVAVWQHGSAFFTIADGATITRDLHLSPIPTGTGIISATFVDDAGSPVQNLQVWLNQVGSISAGSSATTDSTGTVTLSNLLAGTYSISIADPGSNAGHYIYHQFSAATTTLATSSSVVTGLHYVLHRYPTGSGSVHGTVTDIRTGAPVVGSRIFVSNGDLGQASTSTDQNGSWTLSGLPDGTYYVSISSYTQTTNYEYQFDSPDLVISGGSHVERTDTLRSIVAGTASLSGRVRDSTTHLPISGVTVSLSRILGGFDVSPVTTDATGAYSISGLPDGQYSVELDADGYQSSYPSVELDEGAAEKVNFALVAGTPLTTPATGSGSITGVAADGNGNALTGGYVTAYTDSGSYITGNPLASDGSFELDSLPLTSMTVYVSAPYGSTLAQYTGHVSLSVDHPTSNLQATLVEGAVISGSVSIPELSALPDDGLYVVVTDADTGEWAGSATVDSTSGLYSVGNLNPGSYFVQLDFESERADIVPPSIPSVYWQGGGSDGALVETDATAVHVAAGQVSPDHDVTLHLGASITGTIQTQTDDGVAPLAPGKSINVDVYKRISGTWVLVSAVVRQQGSSYKIDGLTSGDYRLRFTDAFAGSRALAPAYNGGATTFASAPVITVTAPNTTTLPAVEMAPVRPSADPDPVNLNDLTPDQLDGLEGAISTDATATAGDNITVDVGTEYAGEWVAVWANSTPQRMSNWVQVGADGKISATLPSNLVGSHRIVVQDADQTPLGWTPITVAAAPASASGTTGSPATSAQTSATAQRLARTDAAVEASSPAGAPQTVVTASPTPAPSVEPAPSSQASAPRATTHPPHVAAPNIALTLGIVFGALLLIVIAAVIVARRRRA